MIVNITTKEGEQGFETNNIGDVQKRNVAHTIIQKVANLEILYEALSFANQAHRATLEDLLMGCEDAKMEEEST
tara:strand:+ start:612 stop:833 length:222 start_codon:yes stop_codon:yes gene_type:complete